MTLPELDLAPFLATDLLEQDRQKRLGSFEHQDWRRRRMAWEKGRKGVGR